MIRSEGRSNALTRIHDLTDLEFAGDELFDTPDDDRAVQNLERWLQATSSPTLQLQQILEHADLGRLLILLLGASQPIADSLIQNPELASIVFDRDELAVVPDSASLEAQGRSLVSGASSYSHALDRLRYLRQRWMLPIVVNDLSRSWPEDQVWQALSDLAQAILRVGVDVVWEEQKRTRGLEGDCPIMVVGFGKLGGRELNYSSDIDLVFVFRDGGEEVRLSRVCEALTRALSDKMGRGSLYRVDMRLRPYGASGPIACSMSSIESYYELYAEPWEVQALLRSKPMAGPPELFDRWEALRRKHCFKQTLAAEAIEDALTMRARTEQSADPEDIKRAAGGIRDVEFLTQILQMVHGYGRPELQVRSTLEALSALEAAGILDHAVRVSLADGYTFLRQVEHRIQFADDRQSHTLPRAPEARERLANLMGLTDWRDLVQRARVHRRTIGSLYQSTLHPSEGTADDRSEVAAALGDLALSALQWFDVLAESEAFYASLIQNRDSLDRVRTVLALAPRLVPMFKASVSLTEMLLSGEIEEVFDPISAIEAMPVDAVPRQVAETYSVAWAHLAARWLFTCSGSLGGQLTGLTDALIRHCARRLQTEFDIIALGSYALGDLSLDSDADVVLFVDSPAHHLDAETHAQFLLGLVSQLRRLGAPINLDLRLRPEGRKGLLVRTYEGFAQYELESMEMWERFALGQSRLVLGSESALKMVLKSAYAQPLTPERLKELLALKRRIENERVLPQHTRRDVKLGLGGLSDIDWFVHLHEMRYPTATHAGHVHAMPDRIKSLGRAHLINAIEVEQLLAARSHLLVLRLHMGLLGLKKDLLPENPDKLDRLAHATGFRDGNALLARHENMIDSVRAIYQEGLERLKA